MGEWEAPTERCTLKLHMVTFRWPKYDIEALQLYKWERDRCHIQALLDERKHTKSTVVLILIKSVFISTRSEWTCSRWKTFQKQFALQGQSLTKNSKFLEESIPRCAPQPEIQFRTGMPRDGRWHQSFQVKPWFSCSSVYLAPQQVNTSVLNSYHSTLSTLGIWYNKNVSLRDCPKNESRTWYTSSLD